MRRIDNRTLLGDVTYFSVLAEMVSLPRNGVSTSYEEMRLCAPLAEKLASASGYVILDEKEWDELSARVRSASAPFVRNNTAILGMCEAVLRAEKLAAALEGVESCPV